MRIFLASLTLVFYSVTANSQIDSELANELQGILNSKVESGSDNGVSAYLIMEDGAVWSGVSGLGAQGLPITDSTVFHGASTTKFNIAVLMLLLEEDGLVDLDLSWNEYVSLDVQFDTLITVRQLLNNTSGIADYAETATSGDDISSDLNYFYTPEYILENIVPQEPDFAPGTDFYYSNSNYVLLGLIAESVTGNPVHEELRSRVWSPLGMNNTYFGAYEEYDELRAGMWWDFGLGLTNYSAAPTTAILSYVYGAGNIVTTPKDLATLLHSVINGEVLSEESFQAMTTIEFSSFSSWANGYGLGIHHAFLPGEDTVLGHDGYYTNMTSMFNSENCGFTLVTMTNTQSEWFGIFNPMYEVIQENCTADITQLETAEAALIYPNPASEFINIDLGDIAGTPATFVLYDAFGRVAQSGPINSQSSINISSLSKGVYTIELHACDKSLISRVVKN